MTGAYVPPQAASQKNETKSPGPNTKGKGSEDMGRSMLAATFGMGPEHLRGSHLDPSVVQDPGTRLKTIAQGEGGRKACIQDQRVSLGKGHWLGLAL